MNNTVLAVNISPETYLTATRQISDWASSGESRMVATANVHMIMETHDDHRFRDILNDADMVTSDGMPLVWCLRLKGNSAQQRVYGPTLMLHVLEMAESRLIPVGFYGSTTEVMDELVNHLLKKYPKLKVALKFSPPFHTLSEREEEIIQEQILQSGARILFVGLGCPKQEIWMAAHKGKIPVVMLGVGAAFDFHAGMKSQSPPILQKMGLEWLFRLIHEPKRLWRRYLINNPRFIILALADLFGLYRSQ